MEVRVGAEVVERDGAGVGRLAGMVFERESRRAAGFVVRVDEGTPREVFVMAGQAGQIDTDRIALTLGREEFDALPDAREHLFVESGQDLEAEVAAAEAGSDAALVETPDPDERPRASAIPGVALLPQMMFPFEVERTAFAEDQLSLEEGLRILDADGGEVGHLGGFVLNGAAQLEGLILSGGDGETIGYNRIDHLDEDAREVTLVAEGAAGREAGTLDAEGAASGNP